MKKFDLKKVDTRKFFGTIIGGVFFLFCILYFTYAYYVWESEQSDVVLGIQDLSIECILGTDVSANDIGPVLDYRDGVKAEFSISSGNTDVVTLSLDITSISENLLVDSFKYVLVYDTEGGTDYDYDNPILEGDFSEFQIGANEITNALTIQGGSTYSYQFIVYIDGTVYNDPNMQQNSLVGSLVLGNCGQVSNDFRPVLATEHIQNLYNDGSTINNTNIKIVGDFDDYEYKSEISLNDTQKIMLDNNGNYRYYGSNPNNYVSFNGELWRIISSGNVKSSVDDTVGENRVKLIKADALVDDDGLSAYSWDSSPSSINYGYGVNDWSRADLMLELNNLYYEKQSGICYIGFNTNSTSCSFENVGLDDTARNLIDNAVYYLGGSQASDDEYYTADDYYTFERGTNVYDCSNDDGACPRATTWTGKIGLMYPSDYGYATDLSLCTFPLYGYYDEVCYGNDWLFLTDEQYIRTITPNIFEDENYKVYFVESDGSIWNGEASDSVAVPSLVYPVVYLRSDVLITGGTGTDGNPYQLSLPESIFQETILSDYVQNLYNDGSTINHTNIKIYDDFGDHEYKSEISLNDTQKIMLDNNGNYRYYGSNPNNYVEFNNELWRIISVGNVKSSINDTVGENRVKLIKADALVDDNGLSSYSWDSSLSSINDGGGVNDWSRADLMSELNNLYYEKQSGICYKGWNNNSTSCSFQNVGLDDTAKSLIDNAVYYLGGSSIDEDEFYTADDYYSFERDTNVYNCSNDDGACPRATTWTGKVGLMYPSDYGYATDLSLCMQTLTYYNAEECYTNDWLWLGEIFTISPNSVLADKAYNFDGFGVMANGEAGDYVANASSVYPVVYLKSDVMVIDGNGTFGEPYAISN